MFDADKRWVNNTCWNYCFFLTLLLLLLYVTVCGTPVVFFHIAVAAFTLENKHYFLFNSVKCYMKYYINKGDLPCLDLT